MTNEPQIVGLIARYFNQPEDLAVKSKVDEFRQQSIQNEAFYQEMEKVWRLSAQSSLLENFDDSQAVANFKKRLTAAPKTSPSKSLYTRLRWVAAAVILIAITAILYLYSDGLKFTRKERAYASDASPGGNKAILVLADGTRMSLSDIHDGDVVKQAGLSITKAADGQLIYNVLDQADKAGNKETAFNTIETPRGGMWQVRLPDGSAVWLNAESSLTYPLSFAKAKNRAVELKGEAYFEVASDKNQPFVVKTSKQEVEVLGTHFNINAYTNETATKTTLLEGSVKVKPYNNTEPSVLKPDEQAILTNGALAVNTVDADEAIDWKNGYFMFHNERQESIMRKIARWYNVEVEYADAEAKDVAYFGSVSRFANVSKVLRKFEQTGEVRFEINNNKITVFKDND